MAITAAQYQGLLTRLTAIEEALNGSFVAMDKFLTVNQMNELLTILQQQADDFEIRLAALEARVKTIEEEPLT